MRTQFRRVAAAGGTGGPLPTPGGDRIAVSAAGRQQATIGRIRDRIR